MRMARRSGAPGSAARRRRGRQEALGFLCDQTVPEPVALLLQGRGFLVRRARELGLAAEQDSEVREVCFAFTPPLTIVTCDPDFRDAAVRGGVSALYLKGPETTMRERLAEHLDEVTAALAARNPLVTLGRHGIRTDPGRQSVRKDPRRPRS